VGSQAFAAFDQGTHFCSDLSVSLVFTCSHKSLSSLIL
jgi:hypothetical protein